MANITVQNPETIGLVCASSVVCPEEEGGFQVAQKPLPATPRETNAWKVHLWLAVCMSLSGWTVKVQKADHSSYSLIKLQCSIRDSWQYFHAGFLQCTLIAMKIPTILYISTLIHAKYKN